MQEPKKVTIDVEVRYRVQLTLEELDKELIEKLEENTFNTLCMGTSFTDNEGDVYDFVQSNFNEEDSYSYEIEVQSVEIE